MVPDSNSGPAIRFCSFGHGNTLGELLCDSFALPFGLSVAVYMSEVASSRTRGFLKPVIELLNGIPSVVYGFFGLIVIVPLIQRCSICRWERPVWLEALCWLLWLCLLLSRSARMLCVIVRVPCARRVWLWEPRIGRPSIKW